MIYYYTKCHQNQASTTSYISMPFWVTCSFNMLPESILGRTRDAGDLRFYFNERTGKYMRLKGETYKLAA